jgi:hypothetical protein
MNLFKKPKVEFLCTIHAVANLHPIKPMRFYRPEWITNLAKKVAESSQEERNTVAVRSVSRCPGIRKLYSEGWVVFNWMDVSIKIKADGTYEWRTSIDQKNISPINVDYINQHPSSSFSTSDFLSQKVPIIKIITPWLAKIPDGYTLFMKGFPYQEHDMFTVGEGMMTNELGMAGVNLQVMWNKPGEYFLPAGMPLAQLLVIKDEPIDAVIRNATDDEIATHLDESVIRYARYFPSYKEIKEQIASYAKSKRK